MRAVTVVALRKESVDRNRNWGTDAGIAARSLSARRAWIEIGSSENGVVLALSRSPQGERG